MSPKDLPLRGRVLVLRSLFGGLGLALAAVLAVTPASALAAPESEGRRASVQRGQLVDRYTNAFSDTYRLSNGHMLTRVYAGPVNYRDAAGHWQPLIKGTASPSPGLPASPAPTGATSLAVRNPLGQENEAACTLTSNAPTTTACNESTFKVGYETSTKATRHALLQFALPDLHEEQIILNAQLELYSPSTSANVAIGAYRVTAPWTVSATWNTSNGLAPWETAGGDYANPGTESDAAINPAVGKVKGWDYWYPTRMVQEWYEGSVPDLGFLLKDVTEATTNAVVTFDGREERTHAPGLTIEWVQRGVGGSTKYTFLTTPLSGTQSLNVNAASGNLMIHSDDLRIPSKGFEFDSARTWNSLQNEAPGYGYGWVDSNAVYIHISPDGSVAYTDSTGNTFPFIKQGANFLTPPGIEATMCAGGSAPPCPSSLPKAVSYRVIYTKTGQRVNFGKKGEYVYPISVEDAAGDTQAAHYTTGLEEPTSWTDTDGVVIAYAESEAKGYTKITDEAQRTRNTNYVEKLGEDRLYHLTQYTNEHNEQTTYAYGTGLQANLLAEITEPSGAVTRISYDSEYRVTKIIQTTNPEHTTGPTTTFTYYGQGGAPEQCTSDEKATVVATPDGKLTAYCANLKDEVEKTVVIYPDVQPPVFGADFEASAYLDPTTKVATLYFGEAEDPPVADGSPGSGVANYSYRYSVNGGAFTAFQQTPGPEVQIAGLVGGQTIVVQVFATDSAGNVSATVTASAAVPPAGEGNPIGEESTESDPSLGAPNKLVAEGIVMSDGQEDGELESGSTALTGLQPAFTHQRYSIVSRGTVRGNANALVVGTAVPGMTFDVKATSGSWYYGRLYKYVGVCAWVQHEHATAKEEPPKSVSTCAASRSLPVKSYASLINCDTCNATSNTPFEVARGPQGEPVDTRIPAFANVRPYTTEHPHEEFAVLHTVVGGKIQNVGWRYITRSGKYALVSASVETPDGRKHTEWVFIEAKYLPSTPGLCRGFAPKRAAKHSSWPPVCREGF